MLSFNTAIPLSLYIHLPWCVRKCPYCDFNSHQMNESIPESAYIQALIDDLDENLPHIWGRGLSSIFFGGGTPSLFSPQSIETLLKAIHCRLRFGQDTEITLEANPGTIDESRFQGFRSVGINRLSLGIQSLQNDKLKVLGRIHDRDYALRAIESTINAGFTRFNVDLMHGLPGQSIQDALNDLHDALQFDPPHLSWYQLTLEPNTFFHHQPPILPEEETLWDIQEKGKSLILSKGLSSYEVSAYAKQDYECLHNKNYWEFGDYLGIGAGAHSKITHMEKQQILRHSQVKNPKDYLNPHTKKTSSSKILETNDIVFEFMLNALRLTKGIPISLFTERTGLHFSAIEKTLKKACEMKLLTVTSDHICPTELGQRFLNDLVSLFLIPALD